MVSYPVTRLRANVAEVVDKVRYSGERIAVEKNGKPACAIVSMEDLELLEAIEDRIDVKAALKAIRKNDFISWKQAKKTLGV
jgi:prevent-host-death family protein